VRETDRPRVVARGVDRDRGHGEENQEAHEDFRDHKSVRALAIPDEFEEMPDHRVPPASASIGLSLESRHAGQTPETTPNISAKRKPHPAIRALIVRCAYGIRSALLIADRTRPEAPSARIPPTTEITTFSKRNWRRRSRAEAPKARRTPISDARSRAR